MIGITTFSWILLVVYSALMIPISAQPLVPAIWEQYVRLVYGSRVDGSTVPPYSLDFIYKRADIEVITDEPFVYPFTIKQFDWMDHFVIFDYAYSLHHNLSYSIQPDNSWVEVIRQSTRNCFIGEMGWGEGLLVHGKRRLGMVVPFGCWFWAARGSGVFVNLRKSLAVDKNAYISQIQSWCGERDPEQCDIPDVTDVDKLFCIFATKMGYDSMQLLGEFGETEILVCYGRCVSEQVDGACPPIELRSGLKAEDECECSEAYPLLNCNRNTSPRGETCRRHPPALAARPSVDISAYRGHQAFTVESENLNPKRVAGANRRNGQHRSAGAARTGSDYKYSSKNKKRKHRDVSSRDDMRSSKKKKRKGSRVSDL